MISGKKGRALFCESHSTEYAGVFHFDKLLLQWIFLSLEESSTIEERREGREEETKIMVGDRTLFERFPQFPL